MTPSTTPRTWALNCRYYFIIHSLFLTNFYCIRSRCSSRGTGTSRSSGPPRDSSCTSYRSTSKRLAWLRLGKSSFFLALSMYLYLNPNTSSLTPSHEPVPEACIGPVTSATWPSSWYLAFLMYIYLRRGGGVFAYKEKEVWYAEWAEVGGCC